jgi:predicted chitinase
MARFNNLKENSIFETNITDFLRFVQSKKRQAQQKGGIGSDILNLILKGVETGQEEFKPGEIIKTPEEAETIVKIKSELSPVEGNIKVEGLSGTQKKNAEIVLEALNKFGIVNPLTQKAILAVIGKESGFIPQNEVSYANTPNERIRQIFGKRVSGLSDQELTDLKRNENAFWDKVYGGRYGNDRKGDGSKYRGRGLNQLTFKGNYKKYNRLLQENGVNVDIVANPDRLNDIEVAAQVNALYFLDGLTNRASKKKFGNDDPNDFTTFDKALGAAVNANAGWGKDTYGGAEYKKALAYAGKFDVEDLKTMA